MKNSKVLVRGIPWMARRGAVGWKSQRVRYRSPWMIFQILANDGQEPHLFLGVALSTQNAALFQLKFVKENFLWGSVLAHAALAAPFYLLLTLRYTTHTHTHTHTHTPINLIHELRAAPCPHSWPEVKKETNPLTFHHILCHERTPHPLYLALYLLSYL